MLRHAHGTVDSHRYLATRVSFPTIRRISRAPLESDSRLAPVSSRPSSSIMSAPKTVRWGILATGGIAKTLYVYCEVPASATSPRLTHDSTQHERPSR